jgi:carboxynorspermidine decarboxylase
MVRRFQDPVGRRDFSDQASMVSRAPRTAGIARDVETPAFVIDERRLVRDLEGAARLCHRCGCKLLYTLKPLALEFVLEVMTDWVDGFATSSLFESRLARGVIGDRGSVHVTTPGLRPGELRELGQLCDYVTLNSLSQLRRLAGELDGPDQVGLRVNPQLSVLDDPRYDPCRRHSKLGVPLELLRKTWSRRPGWFDRVGGLHFHTNCDSASFEPLYRTVLHLDAALGDRLSRLRWINMGGGYSFDGPKRPDRLAAAVRRLKTHPGLQVFIEPGGALVRRAGCLVASVIDLLRVDGKSIAVLDTTVNHLPEVFEYQFEPDVLGHDDRATYEYLLAGSSCLAGDLFGEYSFRRPLRIGSRVVFTDVGAYAMVKAHMFNGINLPTIYSVTAAGEFVLRRRFLYDDFVSRLGVCGDAVV